MVDVSLVMEVMVDVSLVMEVVWLISSSKCDGG